MPVPTFTSAPQPTHSVDTTNWAIVSIPATAWTPAVRTIDAETVEQEAVADCFPGGFDEVAGDWAPVPIEQAHYEITAGSEYVYKLPTPYTGGAVASFTIQGIIHLPSTAGTNITLDGEHSIPALHDRIAFPSLGDGGWNVTENGRCARFYKQISLTYVETADGGPFRPPQGVSGDGTLEVVWGVDVPQDQRPKVYLTIVVAEVDRGATSFSFPSGSSTPGPNPATTTTSSRPGSVSEPPSVPDSARPTRLQATAILATLVPAMLLSLVGLGASF